MSSVTPELIRSYRFMRSMGGLAQPCLHLARCELLLEEAVELELASVEWEWDDQPYDFDPSVEPADYVQRQFESNAWTGPFGIVVKVGDEIASLWGIVLGPRETDDPYARMIAAELAWDLEDELRQTIGDAKDAQMGCLT